MIRQDHGYTILETLVAIAILAIVLVSLYGAGANSLDASRHIADSDRVLSLAQSKLDEIAATPTPLPATSSGTFTGSNTSWRITANTIASPSFMVEGPTLQALRLEITWRDGLRRRSLTVETRHLGQVR